ncbi:MAG: lipoyl(octanoyl) transferase LipB [Pseudomonadota bacterium]|nr:lipoyl(octanoyl) transferase LipB [Pseudomonadota bacterium]
MELAVEWLGRRAYEPVWRAMRSFTDSRGPDTPDACWVVEHDPVFTQGLNGQPEHILDPGDIPIVKVDRGGQVTYHGPGQVVVYLLLDLRRLNMGIRRLVTAMEAGVIRFLADHGVQAAARQDAPGVYAADRKIASLGLRVRRGCSYHGLAFNLDMDLTPFERINPCGYRGLEVTQLRDLGVAMSFDRAAPELVRLVACELGFDEIRMADAA